ncbi:MAG: hypothetical protein WED15_02865 [Akkermansiaceae bacterium]
MKSKNAPSILTAFASLALIGTSDAALVTGTWTSAQGGGPITNENTASPTVGDGTANSADSDALYSAMPTIALANVGEKVTLSGSANLIGIASGQVRQFRWGLYNVNSSADINGWLGYFATQGSGTTVGEAYERKDPNTTQFFAGGTSNVSVNVTGGTAPGTGISFASGDYTFTLSLERVASGLQVESTITRISDSQDFGTVSFLDTTPLTYTFDRVGFLIAGNLDADQVQFSNIDVTLVPEPHSAVLGLIGSALLLLRRRSHPSA